MPGLGRNVRSISRKSALNACDSMMTVARCPPLRVQRSQTLDPLIVEWCAQQSAQQLPEGRGASSHEPRRGSG